VPTVRFKCGLATFSMFVLREYLANMKVQLERVT
jgi:hypothetical protein